MRDEVRHGTLLSEAFEKQGIFPRDLRDVGAGRRESGALAEVLDRYITYQKTGAGDSQEESSSR